MGASGAFENSSKQFFYKLVEHSPPPPAPPAARHRARVGQPVPLIVLRRARAGCAPNALRRRAPKAEARKRAEAVRTELEAQVLRERQVRFRASAFSRGASSRPAAKLA